MENKAIINVVLVDDNVINARSLQRAIENFESNLAEYRVINFTQIDAFAKARKYILDHQADLELLMVDYNLQGHYGIELFKLIDPKKYRVYKILHSITDDSIKSTKNELKNLEYDDFCSSKDEKDIQEALKTFESSVLKVKLFGNKNFRGKFFNEDIGRISAEEADKINKRSSISYFDVLYIESHKNEHISVAYRDSHSRKIRKLDTTAMTLKQFREKGLSFRYINNTLLVNLLWVARIDITESQIKFISADNSIIKLDLTITTLFENEIRPLLAKVSSDISPFFL
jgi:response regulator RpfG family c-di-GMP phosphodiesterase